jgi:microcystin-dependent protein
MGEPYIGEIRIFAVTFLQMAGPFVTVNPCPSQKMMRFRFDRYDIWRRWRETFNLPNLQSRVPIHMGAVRKAHRLQIGETGGVESVTLTTNQIPIHTHAVLGDGECRR